MNKSTAIGLMLIAFSGTIYALEALFEVETGSGPFSGIFFIHYATAILYMIFLLASKHYPWKYFRKNNLDVSIILLILFNICAFSLNRTLTVFNESADWLTVFLVIENAALLVYSCLKIRDQTITFIFSILLSLAVLFHIYQLLMVLPVSYIGVLASPFFGISLLLFVPLFYLWALFSTIRTLEWNIVNKSGLAIGLFLGLGTIIFYSISWYKVETTIEKARLQLDSPYSNQDQLPDWILVSQKIKAGLFTENYLKSGLVYQEFSDYNGGSINSVWRSSFDEKYIHDPLVSIASLFISNPLDHDTKVKILNYLYDSRHQTADRFWSSENLKSKHIVTNVELFPHERLSFTELIITIENDLKANRWRNQQEALYTFNLPEGSAVTSLSLWINGLEEKGILTSKKKATQAYNTIVGREMRDPSVVYWMEGNKIRVRVFPCTPDEDRKFKIGVTSPLSLSANGLQYQSITFKGPDHSSATGIVNLVSHEAEITDSEIDFIDGTDFMKSEGNYESRWSLNIKAPAVSRKQFSFGDESFTMEATEIKTQAFLPKLVYLDLTSNWTKSDIQKVSELFKNKEILLSLNGLKKKNASDLMRFTENIELPVFSLFPFHKIATDDALIITKGGLSTPNLADLTDTPFREKLFNSFSMQEKAPLVIDIGTFNSDYMKSLKEFEVIDYHMLSMEELENCLNTGQFPSKNSDSEIIVIPQNGLQIRKSEVKQSASTGASNHLMRLFYYQKVMKEIGRKYFADDKNELIEECIVDAAATANVVTPVSSLIVLETQNDYDRFDIKKKQDSLGNATINNSGAVPEPHEWALIIIGIVMVLFLYWKSSI